MSSTDNLKNNLFIYSVPLGSEASHLAEIYNSEKQNLIYILPDNITITEFSSAIKFFDNKIKIVNLYEWDCQPYDSYGPSRENQAKRILSLIKLKSYLKNKNKFITLVTPNTFLQKIQDLTIYNRLKINNNSHMDYNNLITYLHVNGYEKVDSVYEVGTYTNRGGIIDIYSPNYKFPLRIDFFGDKVDSLRLFNFQNQRTIREIDECIIYPFSEIIFESKIISNFQKNYIFNFKRDSNNEIYSNTIEKIRSNGIEQYLPLFYQDLNKISDVIPYARIVCDEFTEQKLFGTLGQVKEIFEYKVGLDNNDDFIQNIIKPLNYTELYCSKEDITNLLVEDKYYLTNSKNPNTEIYDTFQILKSDSIDFNDETNLLSTNYLNLRDGIKSIISRLLKENTKVVIFSQKIKNSISFLNEIGIDANQIETINSNEDIHDNCKLYLNDNVNLGSYQKENIAYLSFNQIFNFKKNENSFKSKKSINYIKEINSINVGDLVVHSDYGIGKFNSIKKITSNSVTYDCLELIYKDNDKIHLPVENIELLSLYSHSSADSVVLDKLGTGSWQFKKAKVKERIKEIAFDLINIEAKRRTSSAPIVHIDNRYNEFVSYFGYNETPDQEKAEKNILVDLSKGVPMDRLVCGDVGFGKTELALRSSFIMSSNGYQVVVLVPTTLLAKQHYENFKERFKNFAINIGCLSRYSNKKDRELIIENATTGNLDILIGTHSILNEQIKYKSLGLIIIDEEQNFGVEQKEHLKKQSSGTHILSLSATPIPRSMQLALNGIRDLSIISTPPEGRLPINTSVNYFEPTLVRKAILSEKERNGQSFIICPKIKDIPKIERFVEKYLPEIKYAVAHGKLSNKDMNQIMNDFYENKYDLIIATSIIQSGLDIPNANTIIITNSQNFGLSQIYQIRGRVGRSKMQSSAYITIPRHDISKKALLRLQILKNIESLGMGFILASHDLDIRGAGNILGSQQSGHVKEVGVELFNTMLSNEIDNIRNSSDVEKDWSPIIKINQSYFIPDTYISDIRVRMGIYKRLSDAADVNELSDLRDEIIDRFGIVPEPVIKLIDILSLKIKCKNTNISKIESGKKGLNITFKDNKFKNLDALLEWIDENKTRVQIKRNNHLFISSIDDRHHTMESVTEIVDNLINLEI
ncbi:MAG: transcription-repair coupling factor [Rhodobiaceae bacterium]|nr:transcription-repair coupling factor [Rhodobiaceae bacterium]